MICNSDTLIYHLAWLRFYMKTGAFVAEEIYQLTDLFTWKDHRGCLSRLNGDASSL